MGKTDILLNLAGIALAATLAFLLIRKKTYLEFPFFALYVCFTVVIEVARRFVLHDYQTLFKLYWASEALYALLRLLALHEIFHRVFRRLYKRPGFKWRFPGVALIGLLIAGWTAFHNPPAGASPLIRLVLFFGLAVNFMQICLFALFVFLARSVNLYWRVAPLGILAGFTLSALGGTFAFLLVYEFGTRFESFGKYAPPVAYLLAVGLWLLAFLRPEPEPQWTLRETPMEIAAAMRSETEFLKGLGDKRK